MARSATLLLLLLTVLLFTSCDKMKEKRFSTTIPFDFEIEITEDSSAVIDLDGEITAFINAELAGVQEQIKSYELVGIKYRIWEFYGNTPNKFNGSLGFAKRGESVAGVNYNFTDLDLETAFGQITHTAMNFTSDDIAKIQQYFVDSNGMSLFLSGEVESKPVHFVLQVVVDVDAIAEVEK